jgi:PEP-CTERM motif
MKKIAFLLASTAALALPSAANASFTLTNTNGADGFVTTGPGSFDLFGGDNDVGSSLTTYTDIASAAANLTFNYTYTTNDCCGAQFDPAGYTINGALFQLSPGVSAPGFSFSGVVSFSVLAGDVFGFYVAPSDSILGRGDILVSSGAVPEPASWALMLSGFGLAGAAMRRRQSVRVTYA